MRREYRLAIATYCLLSAVASGADVLPPALAAKGLLTVGIQLVIAQEAELSNAMKNLKSIQGKYLGAYRSAYQAEENVLSLFEEYVAAVTLQQQMIQQFRVTRNTTNEEMQLNKRIREINDLLTNDRQETDAPFLKLVEARKQYIRAIRETSDLAVAGTKRYAELATDSEAKAALEEMNKSAAKPLTFGPLRTFASNAQNAAKYLEFIRSSAIPIRVQDGKAYVDVSVDGQNPEAFRLDPTSAITSTCSQAQIKIKSVQGRSPGRQFPSPSGTNKTIHAGYYPVESVKVGDFEVNSSIVVQLWPHPEVTENRLGLPFFRSFDWEINTEGQTLTLTEVLDPTAKKPSSKATKKKK